MLPQGHARRLHLFFGEHSPNKAVRYVLKCICYGPLMATQWECLKSQQSEMLSFVKHTNVLTTSWVQEKNRTKSYSFYKLVNTNRFRRSWCMHIFYSYVGFESETLLILGTKLQNINTLSIVLTLHLFKTWSEFTYNLIIMHVYILN